MVLLLWAGATGVDVGFTVYGSRQAQAMADTAALDLARYISYADTLMPPITAVQNYLNGKLANVLTDNGSNAHSRSSRATTRQREVHGRRVQRQLPASPPSLPADPRPAAMPSR